MWTYIYLSNWKKTEKAALLSYLTVQTEIVFISEVLSFGSLSLLPVLPFPLLPFLSFFLLFLDPPKRF